MARISVIVSTIGGTSVENLLLFDLEKRQQLREHTINPKGQERYVRPIDNAALKVALQVVADAHAGGAVSDAGVDTFIANTITADDISLATIQTESNTAGGHVATSAAEAQTLQDVISYRMVETGTFLLSFDNGVISKMVALGWVKVYPDDAAGLFTV